MITDRVRWHHWTLDKAVIRSILQWESILGRGDVIKPPSILYSLWHLYCYFIKLQKSWSALALWCITDASESHPNLHRKPFFFFDIWELKEKAFPFFCWWQKKRAGCCPWAYVFNRWLKNGFWSSTLCLWMTIMEVQEARQIFTTESLIFYVK